jgi:hypothetical protein
MKLKKVIYHNSLPQARFPRNILLLQLIKITSDCHWVPTPVSSRTFLPLSHFSLPPSASACTIAMDEPSPEHDAGRKVDRSGSLKDDPISASSRSFYALLPRVGGGPPAKASWTSGAWPNTGPGAPRLMALGPAQVLPLPPPLNRWLLARRGAPHPRPAWHEEGNIAS